MALKSKSPSHEKANFAENPFEQLPRELLLPIVKLTSDLATLWSLSRVSCAVYSLIDDCGKEIVETVLNASEPKQIRILIGPIALLKLGMHPSTSLDEFKRSHVGTWNRITTLSVDDPSLKDLPLAERQRIVEESYGLLPTGTSSMVIHAILQTAYKINRLTPLCHTHFIDKCKNLELAEPSRLKYTGGNMDIEHSEYRKYSIRDVVPPSWIETKRIARAFWYIQLFYDLKNNSKKLHWTSQDLNTLRSLDAERFYDTLLYVPFLNAALTAALYLREATDEHLVHPEDTVPLLRFPQPTDTLPIVLSPPEPRFEDANTDIWGESVHCLDNAYRIPGIYVPAVLITNPKSSPCTNIPFYYYRQLGFAIWDRKRMLAFGLGNEAGKPEVFYRAREMIFKYLSILPEHFTSTIKIRMVGSQIWIPAQV